MTQVWIHGSQYGNDLEDKTPNLACHWKLHGLWPSVRFDCGETLILKYTGKEGSKFRKPIEQNITNIANEACKEDLNTIWATKWIG